MKLECVMLKVLFQKKVDMAGLVLMEKLVLLSSILLIKNAKLQWKRAKFCILQEKAQNKKIAATKLKVELP